MSVTLTPEDKTTLRTAAYGAVTLLAAADAAGKPHKAATAGSIALASATGLVGHVLAEKTKDITVEGRTTAAIADRVLPALTAAMHLLKQHDPAEAGNFRSTVLVAADAAASSHRTPPSPTVADMIHKITAALDA
ncbi:hypothetical protein MF672_012180 [Actinomadura sp. ATCC 31491]|uniref:Serine-type D-Ala-D-Ala carboxypeptidase n=1 Tax=Actinomadura luzonensis TaxID=2805427 RepID=A0ABT0FQC7_9ACTN|nr:hypothetical protein [Actinomadura luzonensis]MCK2214542.1 hypothetical protein [Actinomadura luzonensis]